MPVAQPGAPKCPPFASLCECNKNHYYYWRPPDRQIRSRPGGTGPWPGPARAGARGQYDTSILERLVLARAVACRA